MNLIQQVPNPLPDYRTIPLTQGKVAIVDAVDYDRLMQWKWCAHLRKKVWYAIRSEHHHGRNPKTIRMHRVILGAPNGMEVDHRDGDGLNNRRSNIRLCTHAQNARNHPNRNRNNTSGFIGVSWWKTGQYWRARITVNGKEQYVGYFDSAEKAARARDVKVRELHGEFARLNFPCQ